MTAPSHAPGVPSAPRRSVSLDGTRAIATLLVFFVHTIQTSLWLPAGVHDQPARDLGSSPAAYVSDGLRWTAWALDQAVGTFVVITAIVLTVACIQRGHDPAAPGRRLAWVRKRVLSIYPAWLLCHVGILLMAFAVGRGLALTEWQWWASLAGVRFTPSTMYYQVPAWWYISLLIQVYLVFPWVLRAVRRLGVGRSLWLLLPAALLLRLVGVLVVPDDWFEVWNRGGLVFSRLPEVILGTALGLAAVQRTGGDVDALARRLIGGRRAPWAMAAIIVLVLVAVPLSNTRLGVTSRR